MDHLPGSGVIRGAGSVVVSLQRLYQFLGLFTQFRREKG